jgi:hypothetical protein
MSTHLHLVFNDRPGDITEEMYDRWYNTQLAEVVAVPGLSAARRFRLKVRAGTDAPAAFPYVSMYEVETDVDAAVGRLEGVREARNLPDWATRVRSASWNGIPIGEVGDVVSPEHAFLVFSTPPSTMSFEDYSAWYEIHIRENVENSPLLVRGWRFRLVPISVDATVGASPDMTHLALYEIVGEAAEMLSGLQQRVESGTITLPEWFDEIRFTGIDATAISDRVTETG